MSTQQKEPGSANTQAVTGTSGAGRRGFRTHQRLEGSSAHAIPSLTDLQRPLAQLVLLQTTLV